MIDMPPQPPKKPKIDWVQVTNRRIDVFDYIRTAANRIGQIEEELNYMRPHNKRFAFALQEMYVKEAAIIYANLLRVEYDAKFLYPRIFKITLFQRCVPLLQQMGHVINQFSPRNEHG